MNKTSIFIILFLAISNFINAQKNLPIYILIGQSNAAGNGSVSDLSPDSELLNHLETNHFIYSLCTENSLDDIALLQHGVNGTNSCNNDKFGVESGISFLNRDKEIGFIKYAIGGRTLAQRPDRTDWNTASEEIFSDFVLFLERGLARYRDANFAPEVCTVIWIQGESDAQRDTFAQPYLENLNLLVESTNNYLMDFGASDTPKWIFGGLQTDSLWVLNPNGGYEYADSINHALKTVADTMDYIFHDTRHFDYSYLDRVHYSADALFLYGQDLNVYYNCADDEVAVSNPRASQIICFPNPGQGFVTVEWGLAYGPEVEIILQSMDGKIIRRQIFFNPANQQITLKNLLPGVYVVTLITDQGRLTKKIVIL